MHKIFKKILLTIAVILVIAVFWQFSQNNPKAVLNSLVSKEGLALEPDKFVLELKLLGCIPVGKAIITEAEPVDYQDIKALRIMAQAELNNFFSNFIKASAHAESLISLDNSLPFVFRQNIKVEGKPDDKGEAVYDQVRHVMSIENTERVILSNTHDPLSAIHTLRSYDLNKLAKFSFNINTNQKNYSLEGRVDSKDSILVKGRKYGIWKLKAYISRAQENPYHQSEITLYLLDDKAKTPLLVKVMTNGIYIVASLQSSE